jgi:L-2-hydroxyglutarate oxidase LhgO
MDRFAITIIGAGVVGLALAEELSARHADVLVVEKNTGFGQETSSRNSEVIHAGIYFPPHFLKTRLCVAGNPLLYERCQAREIPHLRRGKLIVAANEAEIAGLEALKRQAEGNGVPGMTLLGKRQLRAMEPEVQAVAALFSPSTGIVDSHQLMRSFLIQAQENGATVVFRSEVTAIGRGPGGYEVELNNGPYRFQTEWLINSAGLHADRVAALAGMEVDRLGYRLKFCKGDYFCASPSPRLHHLVYPLPVKNNVGLGIHATPDLTGRVRFGPDDQYVTSLNYDVNEAKREAFGRSVREYLPALRPETLQPDMSGIRPKLQGPGEPARDFVVREESQAGFPGLVNLIGIESPGLTSSITLARHVADVIDRRG